MLEPGGGVLNMARLPTMQAFASGGTTPKLLLLFGTPRSGTSWLGKIFDSHPQTLYKHEPDRSGSGLPFTVSAEAAVQWRARIEDFAARLATTTTQHTSARLPVFRKSYRKGIAQPIHQLNVLISRTAAVAGYEVPVFQLANVRSPEVRVIWKSTDSLGRLGVLLRNLEDCCAVHILRHPCGYIASVLKGEEQRKFITKVRASEDYESMQALLDTPAARRRGLNLHHLRQFHPVERMAWVWVLLNEKAREDTADDPRCTSIRYEDVCRDPVTKSKQLFSFCGLDWNGQTAEFLRASTLESPPAGLDRITQHSRHYYSIFRNPLESAEKWKFEMKPKDIERVLAVLRQSDLISLYPEHQLASAS